VRLDGERRGPQCLACDLSSVEAARTLTRGDGPKVVVAERFEVEELEQGGAAACVVPSHSRSLSFVFCHMTPGVGWCTRVKCLARSRVQPA
jgi:hypothetical protein